MVYRDLFLKKMKDLTLSGTPEGFTDFGFFFVYPFKYVLIHNIGASNLLRFDRLESSCAVLLGGFFCLLVSRDYFDISFLQFHEFSKFALFDSMMNRLSDSLADELDRSKFLGFDSYDFVKKSFDSYLSFVDSEREDIYKIFATAVSYWKRQFSF